MGFRMYLYIYIFVFQNTPLFLLLLLMLVFSGFFGARGGAQYLDFQMRTKKGGGTAIRIGLAEKQMETKPRG